jgi:hypothetical protein
MKMSVPREIIQNLTPPPLAIPIFLGLRAMVAQRDLQDILSTSLMLPQLVDKEELTITFISVQRFVPLVWCDHTCNYQAMNEEGFLFIHALPC